MGWLINNRDQCVMKDTQDEWSPNFPNDQVKVRLHDVSTPTQGQFNMWRVAVWGNDDIALYQDYGPDEQKAKEVFEKILAQRYVNFDFLRKLGLENF